MSSQGTGSTRSDFVFEVFLEAWGDWARDGSMMGGKLESCHMKESLGGLGWLFTDDEMVVVDSIIASLSPAFKRVVKRVHLHRRDVWDDDQRTYSAALRAFTYAIQNAEEEGRIQIVFLDKKRD